jgi:uncharacterized protein (TIGR00369 family)
MGINGGDNWGARAVEAIAAGDWEAASEASRRMVPLHDRMGISIVRVSQDKTVLTMEMSNDVRGNAEHSVHGGILATFADVACATSLFGSYDHIAQIPGTTDMHVRYYRQPRDGPLKAEARVVHQGSRLLSAECSVIDAEQRVLIRSTATYMIVPRPF